MTALTFYLSDREHERLRALALAQDRAVVDVIRAAKHEDVERKASGHEFRAALNRANQENAKLISQLATE
jgi:predicted transcriptional regulator